MSWLWMEGGVGWLMWMCSACEPLDPIKLRGLLESFCSNNSLVIFQFYCLLSGHDIFEPLISTNFTLTSQTDSFCFTDICLMTSWFLQFHDSQTRMGFSIGMLINDRTKRGSIKWSLPQWHPQQSPPPHPLRPEPTDRDGATHRDDLPVHRR